MAYRLVMYALTERNNYNPTESIQIKLLMFTLFIMATKQRTRFRELLKQKLSWKLFE